MIRFFILFLIILAVLFGLELTPWAERWFVDPWTIALAKISTWLVTLFDGQVEATGRVMRNLSNGFGVSIEKGCNGIEATIVLVSAMLAFPSPWKHKILGILSGFVAVQALNVVRVISLFYLGQWNYTVFEWAHLYVWQALIMLDVLIVFLIWIRLLPESRGKGKHQDGGSGPPAPGGETATAAETVAEAAPRAAETA
ncbi:MAG: exosortase H [Burkholderiales bacterium]|jgi:exosortase H (IPTLxxWG-CTERM-specific)|nr:exosortase H [Burkholderiales bacterium]